MRNFIFKLLLLVILVVVFGFNYRVLSISGLANTEGLFATDATLVDVIDTVSDIEKVEYYVNDALPTILQTEEDNTVMFVFTTEADGTYLMVGTEDDVDGFQALSLLVNDLEPQKVETFALWYYGVAALIILILPLPKKRRR